MSRTCLSAALASLALAGAAAPAAEPPREWVEPTGHRVVRRSDEPGSASLDVHVNGYTAGGDKLLFSKPEGLFTVDLKTRRIEKVVDGRVSHVVVGKKSRHVYYIEDGTVYATDLDAKTTRAIVTRPELRTGSGLTVNADETLLAGSLVEGAPPSGSPSASPTPRSAPAPGASPAPAENPQSTAPPQESRLEARWAARLPMALFTIAIATGAVKSIYRSTDWLNHVQFSPTDPGLLMYCHEGPWHKVDRIWTIRTDGSGRRLMHAREMDMEIAGHEFWSHDGKTVWYDLQTPKSQEVWLAGVAVDG